MKPSKKFQINKADLKAIGTGALIAVAGTLLTYLAELIPNVDFGQYGELISMVLMIAINAGRKWIAGK